MYGVERGGATYALAMELVEGDDLSQRIARGALTLDEVFPIAGQIADALEAAHERAEQRVREILARLGLELHSDKTRRVELSWRGSGGYFRTGSAAIKFGQVGNYVARRLERLLLKRHGRNLRSGQAWQWTPAYLHALGLYRLRGTVQYPEAA